VAGASPTVISLTELSSLVNVHRTFADNGKDSLHLYNSATIGESPQDSRQFTLGASANWRRAERID